VCGGTVVAAWAMRLVREYRRVIVGTELKRPYDATMGV